MAIIFAGFHTYVSSNTSQNATWIAEQRPSFHVFRTDIVTPYAVPGERVQKKKSIL